MARQYEICQILYLNWQDCRFHLWFKCLTFKSSTPFTNLQKKEVWINIGFSIHFYWLASFKKFA